jgi:hypothetical protein
MHDSIESQQSARDVPRLVTPTASAGQAGRTRRQIAGLIDADSDWPFAFAVLTPNGAQALAQELLTHAAGIVP